VTKPTLSLSDLLAAYDEREELRAENERLRGYHEADKYTLTIQAHENERLHEIASAAQRRQEELEVEVERLRAEIEELTTVLNSHRVTYPDRLGHWACEPNRTDDEGLLGYGPPA